MNDLSRVLERVKRLLALAKSANANEAANAARAAQRLITEHQLEEAQLRFEAGDETPFADEELADFGARTSHWRAIIFDGLATANGCKAYVRVYFLGGVRHSTVRVLGPRASVATVRYLFDYLMRQVDELTEQHAHEPLRWRNAFRLGAAAMLRRRLVEAAEETKRRAAADGHRAGALARLNLEAKRLEELIAELGTKPANVSESEDERATRLGAKAARAIPLDSERSLQAGAERLEAGRHD